MKTNSKEISKLAQKIFHGSRGIQGPQVMHPAREWFVGLLIATGLLVFMVALGVREYIKHQEITNTTIENTIGPTPYREAMVVEALEVIADRKVQYDQLLGDLPETPVVAEEEVVATSTEAVATSTNAVATSSPAVDEEVVVEVEDVVEVPEVTEVEEVE